MNEPDLPSAPGSYALRLRLSAPVHLQVGRLGEFDFPAGDYVYLGSAHGPGGIRARLLHHLRVVSRPRWHLDWLRMYAFLEAGWYSTMPGRLECVWSQAIQAMPGVRVPAPGFGSSDCRSSCLAHLMLLPDGLGNEEIACCLGRVSKIG